MPKFERSGSFDSIVGLLSNDILGAASQDLDTYSAFYKSIDLINDYPFNLEIYSSERTVEISQFLELIEILSGDYVPIP